MGLDYSYEIFLPPENVARALTGLAELAPRDHTPPPLPVTLPGGERLLLPFTSRFKSEPVDCSAGGPLALDTSIMIGVDDAVRELHLRHTGRPDRIDGSGRAPVGYVYLTVRFSPVWHPDFASLQFTAATSEMSRMFERSASVRKVFTDLTAASGGACCLLDTEDDTFEICWLNGAPVSDETVPGRRFPRFHDLVAAWRDAAGQRGDRPAPAPCPPRVRYLIDPVAALGRGRPVEQFLGPVEAAGVPGIRWVEVVPARPGFEVVLHTVADIGSEDRWDLGEFPPLGPEGVDAEEDLGLEVATAPEARDALALAEHRTGAVRGRWVNQGVAQGEYRDFVRAGRPRPPSRLPSPTADR
ncbi:hypothetical protein [Kitasatospora sp. NPDC057198]|uniref:hypothetical protein n=1 Tax=Kitasatospora sp. NPDC057198 TaxID=3346046 RepID=UPI00364051ED